MKKFHYLLLAAILGLFVSSCTSRQESESTNSDEPVVKTLDMGNEINDGTKVRFATFNVALNRKEAGKLVAALKSGRSKKFNKLAEVIQRTRPDVILLNEVDYDEAHEAIELFRNKYLAVSQGEQEPIEYAHLYTGPVNTGVAAGIDINQDGKIELPNDAFGFGSFPGQYGMLVLSQFPIDIDNVRSFQNFLWKDMPNALLPINPETKKSYYPDDVLAKMRLSSKNHWDLPITVGATTVHFICSHPTPPVFDGPEDRNGRRNHDEIRMVADYVSGNDYLTDDNGVAGGLPSGSHFVIVGDLNADPNDGDSANNPAMLLTDHELVNTSKVPASKGAVQAAAESKGKNTEHKGDPAHDTGDFYDRDIGNVRIDYCLPSKTLELTDCGVFWPAKDEPGFELNKASDHHLVWIDVMVK